MDENNAYSYAVIPNLPEHFQVASFQSSYQADVLNIFIRSFCDSEPMTRYIDMQYDEFYDFASAVVEKALEDQLSAIVIDTRTDQVAALALVEDLFNPPPLTLSLTNKFDPIFGLLESLSRDYFTNHPIIKSGTHAHLFITAVGEDYRGQGLSTQVNFHAMKLAKEKQFQFMVSELTNHINEKGIVPHLTGFKQCIGKIEYATFIHDNEKPFAKLSGEAHAYLWQLPDIILTSDLQLIFKYEGMNVT